MLIVVDVLMDGGVVDGPFPIFEQSFDLLLASLEVVVPILPQFLAILKPV